MAELEHRLQTSRKHMIECFLGPGAPTLEDTAQRAVSAVGIEPALDGPDRPGQDGVGVCDAAVAAEPCKDERIFRARHSSGPVPEQLPVFRNGGKHRGPILEPGAAYDARRLSLRCQICERREDAARAHSSGEAFVETNMRMRPSPPRW
jgi:hypothetical protein